MRYLRGNIFDQEADALCITTNGFVKNDGRAVMGAGVALDARLKFPGIDVKLGEHINEHGNVVGIIHYFNKTKHTWLVSFPTKHLWFKKADIKLIEQSCRQLKYLADLMHWKKVIVPKPGCKNGKLSWDQVEAICAKHFDDRFYIIDL